MADEVTLNTYTDRITILISDGRYDEAIGLCRHILRYYPKHVGTYRQMATASLEKGDLDDARELFYRVLSADPEDILAYAGLAGIFEQQNLIEQARWQLERAYELSPTHSEIRKELLRLYTAADGRVRQRLKLTPAALARLYVQQGLYSQAIQEFRAIAAIAPDRYDIRVALVQAFWHAGRDREAAEAAQNLIDQLPDSLKANLILGTIWREAELKEGEIHLERASALDPSHQTAIQILGARSPLAAVEVRLPPYVEGTELFFPPRSAPAVDSTSEPDWLTPEELEPDARTVTTATLPSPALEPILPEPTPVEPVIEPTAELPAELLQPLASTAPAVPAPQPAPPPPTPSPSAAVQAPAPAAAPWTLPAWLRGEPSADAASSGSPTPWLVQMQKTLSEPATPARPERHPAATPQKPAVLPPASAPATKQETPHPIRPAEQPEWLAGMSSGAIQVERDLPDWLKSAGEETKKPEPPQPLDQAPPSAPLLKWLDHKPEASAPTAPPPDLKWLDHEPEAPAPTTPPPDLKWLDRELEAPVPTTPPSDLEWLDHEPEAPARETEPEPALLPADLVAPLASAEMQPLPSAATIDQVASAALEEAAPVLPQEKVVASPTESIPALAPGLTPEQTVQVESAEWVPEIEPTPELLPAPTPEPREFESAPASEPAAPSPEPPPFQDLDRLFKAAEIESASSIAPAKTVAEAPDWLEELRSKSVEPAPDVIPESPFVPEVAETVPVELPPELLVEEPAVPPIVPAVLPPELLVEEPAVPPIAPIPVPAAPIETPAVPPIAPIPVPAAPIETPAVPPIAPITVYSAVIQTPSAPATVRVEREIAPGTKGHHHLVQARTLRDQNRIDDALIQYNRLVQVAPDLVDEAIRDLEELIQIPEAPLLAHRILGDAYTRSNRMSNALERYRYVLDHVS